MKRAELAIYEDDDEPTQKIDISDEGMNGLLGKLGKIIEVFKESK